MTLCLALISLNLFLESLALCTCREESASQWTRAGGLWTDLVQAPTLNTTMRLKNCQVSNPRRKACEYIFSTFSSYLFVQLDPSILEKNCGSNYTQLCLIMEKPTVLPHMHSF